MSRFETPRVAIVGAGDIGRGWAALTIANGWPVAIYDTDAEVLRQASDDIADRVITLVRLGRAEATIAEDALNLMKVGRSLLHAVTEADWIIEAGPEDLPLKQKLLEQIEQVARRAAVLTSSSQGLFASSLCARLRRPERLLVTHPIRPVELLPLVEVIPAPNTDPSVTEDVRFWLGLLGRAPVVLKREIPGHVIGRLSAALWRECIHLVLEGIVDIEDIDRAVSVGPALNWAAAGPHLDHRLNAEDAHPDLHLSEVIGSYERWWEHLAAWQRLEPEDQKRLLKLIDKAYSPHAGGLREARNSRLVRLLEALRE